MPAALTDFKAQLQNTTVMLTWRTKHEEAKTYFELQRSNNGAEFKALTKINAKGGGMGAVYSWSDHNPLTGTNFYRLKIVEPGKTGFSKIVSIVFTGKKFGISNLYVTSWRLKAKLLTDKDRIATVNIVSVSGAVVFTNAYILTAPAMNISIPISNLSAGTYILRITTNGAGDSIVFNKLP